MSDGWFRGPEWDPDAREAFERRLARARPYSRPQYLRIKALALSDAGDELAAIELLRRLIADATNRFETSSALETLGDIAARRGQQDEAISCYRQVLDTDPSTNGTSGSVEISLATVLLDRGRPGDLADVGDLLTSWARRDRSRFNDPLFRWRLAHIRLAQAVDDREWARSSARAALELAASGPQLPRHPDVGLVRTDDATLRMLKRLSR